MENKFSFNDFATSWVFENPLRWHFFFFLLSKADKKGWVDLSINHYCKIYDVSRKTILNILQKMEERSLIAQKGHNKGTWIYICDIKRYIGLGNTQGTTTGQQRDNQPIQQKEEQEKKPSPQTPYKEENEKKEVAALPKKEKKPQAENSSSVSATLSEDGSKPSVSEVSTDERRNRFWADCVHCAGHHPEWPKEAVRSFFLFWTQTVPDGRFAFEAEPKWGISYRMASYITQGHWLDKMAEARLQRVSGGKVVSKERAEYMAKNRALYEKAKAEEHDRMELQRQQARQNAITPEEMKRYVEAGLLRPDGLTPQGLRPNPLTLKQQYLLKTS